MIPLHWLDSPFRQQDSALKNIQRRQMLERWGVKTSSSLPPASGGCLALGRITHPYSMRMRSSKVHRCIQTYSCSDIAIAVSGARVASWCAAK